MKQRNSKGRFTVVKLKLEAEENADWRRKKRRLLQWARWEDVGSATGDGEGVGLRKDAGHRKHLGIRAKPFNLGKPKEKHTNMRKFNK